MRFGPQVLLNWIKCSGDGREKAIAAIHSMRPERSTNLMAGITTGAHTPTANHFPPSSPSPLPVRRPPPSHTLEHHAPLTTLSLSLPPTGFSQFDGFPEPDASLEKYALNLVITTDGMPSSQWHPARGVDGYAPLVKMLSKGLNKKRGAAAVPGITTIGIGFQLVRAMPPSLCRPRSAPSP